jgi:hypothetical protein
MNLQRHALQMNLQRHRTSINLQRHRASITTSAVHCMWWFLASVQFQSIASYIFICNANAVKESVKCSANRQVKFVPLADHMVWYSIIVAYTTSMWLREMQCVRLYDHVYLLVSTWAVSACDSACCCIFLRVCPTVCAGGTPHSHWRQQRRSPRR